MNIIAAEYYHRYIQLVEEKTITDGLFQGQELLLRELSALSDSTWEYRYEANKWTLKEVLQHIIDTERIFCYRALCISRGEKGALPGYDENEYTEHSLANLKAPADLIEEYRTTRSASISLFKGFSIGQLDLVGKANSSDTSVAAIGFILCGHELHHLSIIHSKYLNRA